VKETRIPPFTLELGMSEDIATLAFPLFQCNNKICYESLITRVLLA
jgi:hypothetical protein